MLIRTMDIDDYDDVYRLWTGTPGMGLNTTDDSREGIAKYLERNPTTCFVVLDSGRLIGVILSGHDGRRGYIHHTAVAMDQRGRGVGRILVERAILALKDEGIVKAAFVVFGSNEAGNRFWEHMGFQERNDLVYRDMVISDEAPIRIDT